MIVTLGMPPRVLDGKKERFGFKFLNPFKETCIGRALTSLWLIVQ